MKSLQTLYFALVVLIAPMQSLVAQQSPAAALPVTFQVDMSVQIVEAKFAAGVDQLNVRGSFNDFTEGLDLLDDADGDSIYSATVDLPDSLAGTTITFEYFYTHGNRGVGESIADRQYVVPAGGGAVPLSFFDDDSIVTAGPLLVANGLGEAFPGSEFQSQVTVGDSLAPVTNLFGLSFVLNFTNTNFIDVVSGSVLPGSFMGNDVIFFPNVDEAAGQISVGISRKFGQGGVDGHGVVMEARFLSLSATPNNTRVDNFVTTILANDPDGNPISLNPGVLTITIRQCPSVSSIDPADGESGSTVGIYGANLSGVSAVTFSNNANAAFNLVSAVQIITTVPDGAVTGPITLSKAGCPEVQTSTFTVRACPSVSTISPTSAGVGETVTINGDNFTSAIEVLFADSVTATIDSLTATQIRVTVPVGAISGPLTIRTPDCAVVQTPDFTLLCPSVAGINPTIGVAGADVTITGLNLAGVTGVTFSNNASADFTIDNATQITAIAPAAAVTGPITLSQAGCPEVHTPDFAFLPAREVRLVSRNVSTSALNIIAELSAQGNENALSFSLSFDPTILNIPQITLGADASAAQLNVNTGQIGAGRLGVVLALPTGQSFAAGAREILEVDFGVTPVAASTTIDFGDQPLAREVLDINASSLPTTWTPITVALPAGYEADVAPRPFGSRDGSVNLDDWLQVGRFVALLDTPQTSANEFQRIDCSPRTCGDGRLSLADWVQAGRYAASFDTATAACGPNSPVAETSVIATYTTSARTISAQNDTFVSGQEGTLVIGLATEGGENALAFSLNFDANLMTFMDVSLGAHATGATLNVNANQAATGHLGIVMALPAGSTFSENERQLLLVNFAVTPNTNTLTTVAFDDALILREAVDTAANVLPAVWAPATIAIQTPTAVEETTHKSPVSFELGQNYPNPFNPATTIDFAVPRAIRVTIKVFNLLGIEVATLFDQAVVPGRYQTSWHAGDAESGVYFCRMQAEGFVQIRKLVLMQ